MIGGINLYSSDNKIGQQLNAHKNLYKAILLSAVRDLNSKNRKLKKSAMEFLTSKRGMELYKLIK